MKASKKLICSFQKELDILESAPVVFIDIKEAENLPEYRLIAKIRDSVYGLFYDAERAVLCMKKESKWFEVR